MRRSAFLFSFFLTIICSATSLAQSPPLTEPISDWPSFDASAAHPAATRLPVLPSDEAKELAPGMSAWNSRPFALELHLAPIGSPVGHYGLVADYSIFESLSAFAGMGQGGAGLQGVFGARLRLLLSGHWALGYAISGSGGRYKEFCYECGLSSDFAIWNNHELSVEYRGNTGFLFRFDAGMSFALNPGNFRGYASYPTTNPPLRDPEPLPTLSLVVGYSF